MQHKDHLFDNRPRYELHDEYFEICLYVFKHICIYAMYSNHSIRSTYAWKQKYAFTFAYQNMLSVSRTCLALLRN